MFYYYHQAKDAVHSVRESLPSKETIKKKVSETKEKVEDAAHTVKETIKDALPSAKGESGQTAEKVGDLVFLEEAGKALAPPPLPEEKYKK